MVGMQNKNTVECPLYHRVDHIVLAGRGKHHVQKVACIAQAVLWVHIGLAGTVFVGHGHQRWHFRDQAQGRYIPVLGVVDVGAVMVEGRQRANQTSHDGHWMGITAKTTQKELHLLVDHGVVGHALGELGLGSDVRQAPV